MKTPPALVKQTLIRLGRNIRVARLRRRLRLQDLADRIGVSRYVMADVEKGKPTVAVSSYIGALWVLGLLGDFQQVADPDRDEYGKTLENLHAPHTAAKRKKVLDNDF